jgi:signal transduction histidine kinase
VTIWAIIPLITLVAYTFLFILTLPLTGRRTNRLFAYYVAVSAIWSLVSSILHLTISPRSSLLWNEITTGTLIWTLIAYYHFIRAYINKPAGIATYIGYIFTIVLTILCLKGYIVQYAYVNNGVLYHSLGSSIYVIAVVALFYSSAGIILLGRKYHHSPDIIDRNRTAYLIAGWSILVAFSYTNVIPAIAGLPLDHIGSLFNALIIAYAIRRYRIVDIKLVIRKGLSYSGVTIFMTALFLLLLATVQMFFQNWLGYSSLTLAATFSLIVAVLFDPLRNFIQRWIDRLFYRRTYDYREVLLNFTAKISNVLDLGELAQIVLDPIVETMQVKQAALLFPEFESGDFNIRFVQQVDKEQPFEKLKFHGDSPIVTWLNNKDKALRCEIIDMIPQLKAMWEIERIALDALGVKLLCPIKSKGKLISILALGKKQSDSSYSDEEIDLLATMANEAAVAIENARMLDNLKSQQMQVEQLLAQVVLAQEEERNRISIDLHDSVAQWLVAASYDVQTFRHALSNSRTAKVQGAALTDMENTITKSLRELRRVVVGLRPPALDELGLTHALRQSLDELKTDGVDCQFSEEGTSVRLPSSVEIAVYRIVQETMNNIRKHAGATMVDMQLQFQDSKLVVVVHDNGKGFNLSQTLYSALPNGHLGLLGMKQRAEMLGGDLRIMTGKGKGTTVTLSLPLRPRVTGG